MLYWEIFCVMSGTFSLNKRCLNISLNFRGSLHDDSSFLDSIMEPTFLKGLKSGTLSKLKYHNSIELSAMMDASISPMIILMFFWKLEIQNRETSNTWTVTYLLSFSEVMEDTSR